MTAVARWHRTLPAPGAVAGTLFVALAAAGSVVGIAVLGWAFVALPAATAVVAAALFAPERSLWWWLAAGVSADSSAVGITKPLSAAIWVFPEPIARALPLTVNPFEVVLMLLALSLAIRRPRAAGSGRLPGLVLLVPLVIVAGLAVGVGQGGKANLAYQEARGLIFGSLTFWMVWRVRAHLAGTAVRAFLGATSALALLTILRYAVNFAPGSDVPMEFWFSHETGLFLGIAFIAGLALTMGRGEHRLASLAYTVLMFAALLVTGRRSAVLVVAAGMLVAGWLVLPRRPVPLVAGAVALLLLSGAYLAAFWDAPAGPLAEPARAVRSQIDPDARDRSSDQYRKDEREDVERTLRESPVLGVGFGRPFTQYIELPPLEFWTLQSYTSHQNILWLWLKMGLAGAAVLLGCWVLALGNCLAAVRASPRHAPVPIYALVLAAALVMYLAYARVDHAFVTTRATAPLAVLLAVAFSLPRRQPKADPEGDGSWSP